MAIINASNWYPTRTITVVSKTDLLQELILAEVVHRQLKALISGMDYLSLTSLLKKYPVINCAIC